MLSLRAPRPLSSGTNSAIPVAGDPAAAQHHAVRRRTALLVLVCAAAVEMFSIWRFRHVEAHRWSILAALAAVVIVAAVLDMVLSVALRDHDT